jgi:hypothetical protein
MLRNCSRIAAKVRNNPDNMQFGFLGVLNHGAACR